MACPMARHEQVVCLAPNGLNSKPTGLGIKYQALIPPPLPRWARQLLIALPFLIVFYLSQSRACLVMSMGMAGG